MNFERTLTTDIFSDFMQSKVGWVFHLPCTLYVTDRAPNGSPVNGHFNKLKKLSYTLVGGHAIYTMACDSNAAAAIGSWLSSKRSPHQTIRAHKEKELLRMISHKRRLVAKIA